jgi:hypothetical protein
MSTSCKEIVLAGTEYENVIGVESTSTVPIAIEPISKLEGGDVQSTIAARQEEPGNDALLVDNTLALVGTEFEPVFAPYKSTTVLAELIQFDTDMTRNDVQGLAEHLESSGLGSIHESTSHGNATPETELDLYSVKLSNTPEADVAVAKSTHSSEWDLVSNA